MHNMNNKQTILYQDQAYHHIRSYFRGQGFIEVFAPSLILANTPDPYIDPLVIKSNNPAYKNWQLHTSPELWLKKSLSEDLSKVFYLGRVFRDDISTKQHLLEFTMLEWYRSLVSLYTLIEDCKILFLEVAKAWQQTTGLVAQMPKKYVVVSLWDLFKKHLDLDLDDILDATKKDEFYLSNILQQRGELLVENAKFTDAFSHVMVKYIEPALNPIYATIIERWPMQLAALSAPCSDDPRYCQRFELYYQGLEIANAYEECNDAKILQKRFSADNKLRKSLKKSIFMPDDDFFNKLKLLPPTCGIALGVDRLMMTLAKSSHINEVFFGAYANPTN